MIDTHVDTATHLLWRSPNFSQHLAEGHVDIPRMREGGLDAAMFAVWIDEGFSDEETLKLCLRGIESVHRTIDAHPDDLAFAQTATVWECASSVHIPVQADGRRVLACAGMTGRNRDSLSQLAVSGAEGKSAASMFSGRVAAPALSLSKGAATGLAHGQSSRLPLAPSETRRENWTPHISPRGNSRDSHADQARRPSAPGGAAVSWLAKGRQAHCGMRVFVLALEIRDGKRRAVSGSVRPGPGD